MRLTESTHGYSREKNATHFAFREGREGGGGDNANYVKNKLPRNFRRFWVEDPPSFRNHFRQKTVYL